MLQTRTRACVFILFLLVSSPQGNATNSTVFNLSQNIFSLCFKSPRECYKLIFCAKKENYNKKFQVPKGMLQTQRRIRDHDFFAMFQVPKGMLQTVYMVFITRELRKRFQVPKGMLQTTSQCIISYRCSYVSSPQGNATNSKNRIKSRLETERFKSPRECYKHHDDPAYSAL